MFDRDELEEIRESGLDNYVKSKREVISKSQKKRFIASFSVSIMVLMVVLSLVFSQVLAVQLASVGGFTADIERIDGSDVALYPTTGETSACPPGFQTESGPGSGLAMYAFSMGGASIPEKNEVTIQKDISTPGITGIDTVRISLTNQPTPSLNLNRYPSSSGNADDGSESLQRVNLAWGDNGNLDDTFISNLNGAYEDRTFYDTQLWQNEWTELTVDYNTSGFNHYVRAFIDWDQDGDFSNPSREWYDVGTSNNQPATNSTFIYVPDGAEIGSTLMRVSQKWGSYPQPDEDFSFGQVADYTLYVYQDGPVALGDATMKISDLEADILDVQNNVVINDRQPTNLNENPFGRSGGELIIEGQDAFVRGASARVHSISFQEMGFPNLFLEMEYNPTSPNVKQQDYCNLDNPRLDVHITNWDRGGTRQGGTMSVTADIINPGNPEDSNAFQCGYIEMDTAGAERDQVYECVDAGNTQSVTLNWNVPSTRAPGSYTITVSSPDDSQDVTAAIEGLRVTALYPNTVDSGTANTMYAYVYNPGTESSWSYVECSATDSTNCGGTIREYVYQDARVGGINDPGGLGRWEVIGDWTPDCNGDRTVDVTMNVENTDGPAGTVTESVTINANNAKGEACY